MKNHVNIIAEIGINHNGSIEIAKKLIELAKHCGCDIVKFQKRNLDICIPINQKHVLRETPWGNISYLDYKKKLEFDYDEFLEIDNFCKKFNIDWFASSFDIDSIKFLEKFKLKYNKIPSALITNIDFVREVAKKLKYTFISTGMCNLTDIDLVVEIFEKQNCPFELMHCIGSYPAKEEDLNLTMISVLKDRYKCKVGYSGHESSVSPSVIAATLGASTIERHITLNRASFGTDQAASLEKSGLETLVSQIRKLEKVIGDGIKKISKEEKEKLEKLKYW